MRRISYGTNSIHQIAIIYFTYGPWWSFWLEDIVSWLCSRILIFWLPAGEFFHAGVDMPISHFCWRRQAIRSVKVDYGKLKEASSGRDIKHWKGEQENDRT